jgi:hypothetical protein
MSAITIPRLHAASVLRVLSVGRTKPCLMLCTDTTGNEHEVVVKWQAGMELKETGLVCELISALVADDLDLPIPKPYLVEVDVDFHKAIGNAAVSKLAQNSAGLNFGCQKLPPGFSTWAKDRAIPMGTRPLAAEVFAFDVLIQNPDRRRDNPNLLTDGEEIYLCDHEQSFSFLAGVIDWHPPWTGKGTDFFRNHVFFHQLLGTAPNFDRLRGAVEALTNTRLNAYLEAIPDEWCPNRKAVDRILEYLREARQNRAALFGIIGHLLT